MNDKRSFPRSVVDLTILVLIEDKWVEAKIIDLTVEGISMELNAALGKNTSATLKFLQHKEVKDNEVKITIIRCLAIEGECNKFHIVAKFIEPNDEFLMDVLALVHDSGPKKDRRGTIYGGR